MTTQSDLLNARVPSPTTLVASVGGAATTVYTAPSTVEAHISGFIASGGNVKVNGITLLSISGANQVIDQSFALGAGQVATVVTNAQCDILISAKAIP